MLKLITDTLSPENPTIIVRWCIDPSDRAKLLELGADNIHVLLVTAYENDQEDRQLRPLAEAMTYVGFRFPGKHTLLARLVWPYNNVKEMRKALLQRYGQRSFMDEVLAYRDASKEAEFYEGRLGCTSEDCSALPPAEPLDVVMDKGHFPKEPPEWLKDWVNIPYKFKPVDQCHFKKRLLSAILIQPFVALVAICFYAAIFGAWYLFGALVGARGLSFRALLKVEIDKIWPEVTLTNKRGYEIYGYSAWIVEDRQRNSKPFRILVSPLAFVIYFAFVEYLHRIWKMTRMDVLRLAYRNLVEFLLKWNWQMIMGFVILLATAGVVSYFIVWMIKAAEARQEALEATPEYQARRKAELEVARQQYLDTAYRYLTCPTVAEAPVTASLQGLPKERRTLRLRFYDLKRKVCRPYAG